MNDNRGVCRGEIDDLTRDRPAQNVRMVEALTETKYDVNDAWGIGIHSNKQGGALMPEMLRWPWRDHPRKDDPKDPGNRSLLVPNDALKAATTTLAPAKSGRAGSREGRRPSSLTASK